MHRPSIFAPLLLIGIGGIFLARNVFPDLPLLDYVARYWPLLLVVWGVLRIAEVLYWSSTSKPLPQRGVSGGEWALIVLLVMFGGALHAVRGFSDWFPAGRIRVGGLDMFGESYDYPLAGTANAGQTPRVIIESFRGNARITGSEGSDVKVSGHQSIRSLDQSSANRASENAKLEVVKSGNSVTIQTNQSRVSGQERATAEMEIVVPKGATIEAHGRYGDFDITDIQGNVEIISDNAGVRLQNIGGNVRIDLRNSDIVRAVGVKGTVDLKGRGRDIELENIEGTVSIDGSFSGNKNFRNLAKHSRSVFGQTEIEFERLPGDLRVTLGDLTGHNIVGPTRITSTSKDIELSDYSNGLDVSLNRGDIDLRPGNSLSRTDARTKSGDVTFFLSPTSKYELTASTDRGEANNDFGNPLKQEWSGKRGAMIRGGNGNIPVNLHSDRGAVTVRKAGDEDKPMMSVPPTPPAPPKRVDQ